MGSLAKLAPLAQTCSYGTDSISNGEDAFGLWTLKNGVIPATSVDGDDTG